MRQGDRSKRRACDAFPVWLCDRARRCLARRPCRRRRKSAMTAAAATTRFQGSAPATRRSAPRAASATRAAAPGASPIRAPPTRPRDLLAEEPGAAARGGYMLRVRRARRRRRRAARAGRSNIPSTASAAITAISTCRPNPAGAACKAACEAENRCRAWTYVRPGYLGAVGALLSQGQDHARRGKSRAAFPAWCAELRQWTAVKNRDSRKPDGQVQIGWSFTPRSHEPTSASTRPTRSSTGSMPTPPARPARGCRRSCRGCRP